MDKGTTEELERRYPGISATIEHYERAPIPPCPSCKSDDTAKVSIGVVGRSINQDPPRGSQKSLGAQGQPGLQAPAWALPSGYVGNVG